MIIDDYRLIALTKSIKCKVKFDEVPNYNLNNLGSKEFETLVQDLLKKIISPDTTTFGDGGDGSREATYVWEAPYPSETQRWKGRWIFQAKFHNTERIGPDKAREKLVQDLTSELNKITSKHKCDNYILATNVVLTAYPEKGTLDKINKEIIPKYNGKIKNIRVWGYDEICRFLSNNRDVRIAYSHLLTSGDILEDLMNKIDKLNPNHKGFSDREIKEYLRALLETKYETLGSDESSLKLKEWYINHEVLYLSLHEAWFVTDEQLIDNPNIKSKDAIEMTDELLETESIILITSHFGIGKSTLSKMIAINYGLEFLSGSNKEMKYFPIYVNLNFGLSVEYKKLSLKNFLDLLPFDNADHIIPLLILDGLDEYDGKNDKILYEQLEELRSNHSEIKVIITTRIQEELLEKHRLQFSNCIRLLPFNSNQIDIFFEKFKVKYKNKQLTYEKARSLNFPLEIISIPLLLTILNAVKDGIEAIRANWSSEMKKTWIFLLLFHKTICGKYNRNAEYRNLQLKFRKEKNILRLIAALKNRFPNLTVEELRTYFESPELDVDDLPFLRTTPTSDGLMINFLHKSYSEYLLAEYYVESILSKRIYRLSIGYPTLETINYLTGLIGLLKEASVNQNLDEHLITDQFSLINSICENQKYQDEIINELEEITVDYLKNEINMIWSDTDPTKSVKVLDKIWIVADVLYPHQEDLLIHQWIVLNVNRRLNPDKKLDHYNINEAISKIIRMSSNLMPAYLRFFPNVNLSGKHLLGSNLRGANLKGANLKGANLESVDFAGATLKHARMDNARLIFSDFTGANLQHANMKGANLEVPY